MKLLILASVLVAAVSAAPGRSYGLPRRIFDDSGSDSSSGSLEVCSGGLVLNVDGTCVPPRVHRQVYVYTAPPAPKVSRPRPPIPPPEVITNVMFIRIPEQESSEEDIIVPPPRTENVIYVLNKREPPKGPRVIEVPAGPQSNPEVYFVHYKDGENPKLPGGIDLRTALSNAAHAGGTVIGDDDDGGFSDDRFGDDDGFGGFDDDFSGISKSYGVPS